MGTTFIIGPADAVSERDHPMKGNRTSNTASDDRHLVEIGAALICAEIALLLRH